MFIVPWRPELVYGSEFRDELDARRSAILADFRETLAAILERHGSSDAATDEIRVAEEYMRGRLDAAMDLTRQRFPPFWIEAGSLPC